MARKVLISFLGTNDYVPTNYTFGTEKVDRVRFIQEALARMFCKEWASNDKCLIFLTTKAKENWLDKQIIDEFGDKQIKEGLESRLNKLKNEGFYLSIEPIENTPEGLIEEDIWKIFESVFNILEENDEVILDITHSFRSIPMLGMVLLQYAKFLKNISIKGIYYGAFEVLGFAQQVKNKPVEERNAPIVDLTSFALLQEWTSGVNEFIKFGSIEKIAGLTQEQIKPILVETKGGNQNAKTLRGLANNLREFTENIRNCRGQALLQGSKVKEIQEAINNVQNSTIKPLNPILAVLSKKIEKFKGTETIENGLSAVEWCIDTGLIQQGFTLLLENVITAILISKEMDYKSETHRNIVSSCFAIASQNIEESNWEFDASKNKELTKEFLESTLLQALKGKYDSLGKYRNDINHAGMRPDARPAKEFKKELNEAFNKIKEIINQNFS